MLVLQMNEFWALLFEVSSEAAVGQNTREHKRGTSRCILSKGSGISNLGHSLTRSHVASLVESKSGATQFHTSLVLQGHLRAASLFESCKELT